VHLMDTILIIIYEWQWSDTTDTARSHDNDNMAKVVNPDYIHTTYTLF